MNEIQNFNFENEPVRITVINNEPWFLAYDVCQVLGYTNGRDAIARHVENEDKNTVVFHDGIQGNPNKVIINESGLYSLVFASKLPKAKSFKRWVTNTVLPSIRKNGGYIAGQENQTPAEILANAMIVAQKVIEDQKAKIAYQAQQIKQNIPKVIVYDAIVEKNNLYNTTQVANKIGKSAIWLNKQLEELGVYSKSIKRSRAFRQWFMNDGLGIMRETENGYSQCMFTARGEAWIIQKLTEEGII